MEVCTFCECRIVSFFLSSHSLNYLYFIWTDWVIFKIHKKTRELVITVIDWQWTPRLDEKTRHDSMFDGKNKTRLDARWKKHDTTQNTRRSCTGACSLECLYVIDQFIFSGAFKYLGICVLTFKFCLLLITIEYFYLKCTWPYIGSIISILNTTT